MAKTKATKLIKKKRKKKKEKEEAACPLGNS
jgi:hypothetical protein